MTLEQTKKFTEQDENTLQYYNQNATKFIENTKSVDSYIGLWYSGRHLNTYHSWIDYHAVSLIQPAR